jgi:hypothetical protein
MSDVVVRWLKCIFCGSDAMEPGRPVCAECHAKNQAEPEPSPIEVLAMDLSDLQDDVAELFRRLSGKAQSDVDEEEVRRERKERFERMLRLVEAVAGGTRG